METWLTVAYIIAFGALVIYLLPRARAIMQQSRKAEKGEWRDALIPLLLVLLFIILVIQSVR